ncbi:spore germination protein [Desulfothermobacter acidiphilus]|uniref:spore germination protein n=1 Tax=Desulfothermobacter acidiphilus TaxID=1938353 RepID=UPI003F888447
MLLGTRMGKKLEDLLVQSKRKRRSGSPPPPPSREEKEAGGKVWEPSELYQARISSSLEENLTLVKRIMEGNEDFEERLFYLGSGNKRALLIFLANMVERAQLNRQILENLMFRVPESRKIDLNLLREHVLTVAEICELQNFWDVFSCLAEGCAILFVEGESRALGLDVRGYERRAIEEPVTESTVRGPRDGFVEDVEENVMLIRRRLRTPNLVMEKVVVGRLTQSAVIVSYIKGLANPALVAEVKKRIAHIDMDAVYGFRYVEEMIVDNPYTFFPQAVCTERPDRVCGALTEGRVAILVDTTPFALIIPASLPMFLQTPEDYYHITGVSTAIRWLRYLAFIFSVVGSPLYVAISNYHPDMIPARLLFSLAAAREGVPLPAFLEAFMMEVAFELLREAGIRLPRQVGQAVSIVGALIIGEAAVRAGLVSPLMVIVVAATGIASFTVPSYEAGVPMRLLRFPLLFLAAVLGLFGVTVGLLAILIHLAGLRSFGLPYLSPLAPLKFYELRDVLVRAPFWAMDVRPGTSKRNWFRISPWGRSQRPAERHGRRE